MEAFIRFDQYNYIQDQTKNLVQGHTTSNDSAVTQALKSMTHEKVLECFQELESEQKELLEQVQHIKDETEAIFFLSRLKQLIVPFPQLNENEVKKLFPKIKKFKIPNLNEINWNELSYLGWTDHGSNRKYMITYQNGKFEPFKARLPLQHRRGCVRFAMNMNM
ncbi:FusB/FusC family EF-G-binding protein [Halobacillus sp. BBL2006]|uniref:FusB/FusC family EF-G-binding protein n=1 Tax=Halobacillus sp. BBL2006 TaxID=1543706 RepID=UPI00069069BA|nr:elongation factor G-binding protein [Halobacillus sp. BBL2006]